MSIIRGDAQGTLLPAPYYEQDGITICHGDCRELLPQLEPVDHVITDPPYSEHVHSKYMSGDARNGGYGQAKSFGFDSISGDSIMECARWFVAVRRWSLVFSDIESCHLWRSALVLQGLDYIRTGAWVKLACTPQFTGDRPAAGFEAITIAHRTGKKRWNGHGSPAVWTHQVIKGTCEKEPRVHTAQKPLSLIAELVSLFTDAGETILDPFMGSGTTLRAAKDLGRKAIGLEIDERYCEIAAKRLSQRVFDFAEKP